MYNYFKKIMVACVLLNLSVSAQEDFPELNVDIYDAGFDEPLTVVVPPSPVKYDILFVGGDAQVYDATLDTTVAAKEWHDFTGFISLNGSSDSGYVIVNHERLQADPVLGDGGGMTVFKVEKNSQTGVWQAVKGDNGYIYNNVDFSGVGGTLANCGGIQTSWGRVFTAEEWMRVSNSHIYDGGDGITDTSDFTPDSVNGKPYTGAPIKKYTNFNWMVEVDPMAAKAVRKNYNMGRFAHEGGAIAEDEKTVYLSDDQSPGYFYKFVAEEARDFSEGTLYVYKQNENGVGGEWLAFDSDNLMETMYATDSARAWGGTMIMRGEWVDVVNGKVYMTETGRGDAQSDKMYKEALKGGTFSNYWKDIDAADGTVDSLVDSKYGRIVVFDPVNNTLSPFLEGGGEDSGADVSGNHLSSPDGLTHMSFYDEVAKKDKTYLFINEDLNNTDFGMSPDHFGSRANEIYYLDLDIENPTVKDLHRFLIGPKGCETTGGRFTPDGSTYFVNLQHPSSSNPSPFNHSMTIAVSNYMELLKQAEEDVDTSGNNTTSIKEEVEENNFSIYPNPASRELHLNKAMDIAIYNITGQKVLVSRNKNKVDISTLASGQYLIQNLDGEVRKLVIE